MNAGKNRIIQKIAEFIVDKRKGILVLFFVAVLYCLSSISKVQVEDDLTKFLPMDTETRIGVDIMDESFTTFGSARILVANITYDRALILAKKLESVDGISKVAFYDESNDDYNNKVMEDYYKDSSALYTISFDEEEDTELSQKAMAELRSCIKDYDSYVYTTVDKDDSRDLQEDMKFILVIAAAIILGVLLFTSTTYMEIPIFLIVFLTAAILNKGTNYLLGSISFISNAVDIILQLALAIDYAIILFHRYMEETDKGKAPRDAMVSSLSKAIVEISSSSLTTISGMVSLMFMQFGIGFDLGAVLTKAIVFSMLTVFLLMPALIMMFQNQIVKTRHKSFVPKITGWGKFIVRTRFVLPVIFLAVIAGAIYWSANCPYIYDRESVNSAKKTEYIASKDRIQETFDMGNTMALVLPKGDYDAESAIISELSELDYIDEVTGLANIDVGEEKEYVLTDKLNPREFAEAADIDVGLSKLLYSAYAQDQNAYGAFVDGIDKYRIPVISLIDFIYDEKEKGAFTLSDKTAQDITDIHKDVSDARKQLESDDYSRIVFTMTGPVEGKETFDHIDEIRQMAQKYYNSTIYVVGDPTSDYDLSKSFSHDNTLISFLTAFFVGVILLGTFQSAGLPFILLLTIQGSIWINFSVPYLTNDTMFFLSYLIVSSIQMGATIDYAIVITNRYLHLRKKTSNHEIAIARALNESFPTVLTSGLIMSSSGFIIGQMTSNPVIASLGKTLGIGTLLSIILVMSILPQMLYLFEPFIDRVAFTIRTQTLAGTKLLQKGSSVVNGTVKGYFCGYIDGTFSGTLSGDMDLALTSGMANSAADNAAPASAHPLPIESTDTKEHPEEVTHHEI